MYLSTYKILKNIVACSIAAMFFSCTNNSKEVQAFFLTKNLPVGVAKNIVHVYKDSGRVTSKMITSLMLDFSNRREHPYNEFPLDITLISYSNNGKDSITIKGDYALTYTKTMISALKGNVIIINHKDKTRLVTDELFWDQNTDYFYSEKKFTLTTPDDIIHGIGFESKKDLSKFSAKQQSSQHIIKEN